MPRGFVARLGRGAHGAVYRPRRRARVRQLAPALEGLEKSLGTNHPEVSTAFRNLEKALMGLAETQPRSRREDALRNAEQALEVATKHGDDVTKIERWIEEHR